MAANAFPGEIGDGPISKYFCIYVFYVCAQFHTCIIKRTIHSHIGWTKGKLAIFKSFITSNFNYCPLIWHFYSQSSTKKLEKIQERALRFIYNDYSSTHHDLLKTANTEHLHVKKDKRNGMRSIQNCK